MGISGRGMPGKPKMVRGKLIYSYLIHEVHAAPRRIFHSGKGLYLPHMGSVLLDRSRVFPLRFLYQALWNPPNSIDTYSLYLWMVDDIFGNGTCINLKELIYNAQGNLSGSAMYNLVVKRNPSLNDETMRLQMGYISASDSVRND